MLAVDYNTLALRSIAAEGKMNVGEGLGDYTMMHEAQMDKAFITVMIDILNKSERTKSDE